MPNSGNTQILHDFCGVRMPRNAFPYKPMTPGEARELIYKAGRQGIENACRIAAGKPVYRRLKNGAREAMHPSIDQMQTAQKMILGRILPELKAVEFAGEMTTRNVDEPQHDVRQISRAILSVLGSAILDGGDTGSPESPQADKLIDAKPLESQGDTGKRDPSEREG